MDLVPGAVCCTRVGEIQKKSVLVLAANALAVDFRYADTLPLRRRDCTARVRLEIRKVVAVREMIRELQGVR